MNSMQLPPHNDFEATWAFLEEGLDQVMCRFEQGLTRARYSILYSAVHNYCARSETNLHTAAHYNAPNAPMSRRRKNKTSMHVRACSYFLISCAHTSFDWWRSVYQTLRILTKTFGKD
ncbi:Putative Cullin 1 [Rhizopus microsporus]|nr:Putative Cullin 1 [Rhizopus microsporus]